MSCEKKIFVGIRRSKGVTMMEMLLVLAIIAVLLVLATRYYVSTKYSQRVSQLQEEIDMIKAATSNWALGHPNLQTGNLINTLYTSGYLSKADLDATQTNAVTPWGDNITVSQNSTNPRRVDMAFNATSGDTEAINAYIAVKNLINANANISTSAAACDTSGKFTYTFTP